MGRPDARRGAARPLPRRHVVGLDHAFLDGDDGDLAAAVERRDAARLQRGPHARDDPVALEHREPVGELVGHEDPPAGGRGVVGLAARGRAVERAARERDAQQRVGVLRGNQHRPARCGQREVPRRRRQRHAPHHVAGRAVDERQRIRAPQPDRHEPGPRIRRHALGLEAHAHDPPRGSGARGRRGRGLGGRRELLRRGRAAAGEQGQEQREECERQDRGSVAARP